MSEPRRGSLRHPAQPHRSFRSIKDVGLDSKLGLTPHPALCARHHARKQRRKHLQFTLTRLDLISLKLTINVCLPQLLNKNTHCVVDVVGGIAVGNKKKLYLVSLKQNVYQADCQVNGHRFDAFYCHRSCYTCRGRHFLPFRSFDSYLFIHSLRTKLIIFRGIWKKSFQRI